MTSDKDDDAWFAHKRYGLGAGLPISWQGWAMLLGVVAAVIAAGVGLDGKPILQAAIVVPLIITLVIVSARKTRGGWRWRWGGEE